MKGLFCCMPIENIYRFAVYGLREQFLPIPANSPHKSPKNQRKGASQGNENMTEDDAAVRDYFNTPWIFCNDDNPLVTLPSNLQRTLQQAGHAWKTIQKSVARPVLRFSKYSTISTMTSYPESQTQSGICLALCRVLMVRIKTINTYVDDLDITASLQQGYDAIYSSLRQVISDIYPPYSTLQ